MAQLHDGQPVLRRGRPLHTTSVAIILIHGRGATAEDIMRLSESFPQEIAFLAPQAANNSWYPQRFLVHTSQNEPWLSSGLNVIDGLIGECIAAGIEKRYIFLIGFSQGACLALEFAARNPARYGGVFALSGALIGGDDEERKPVEGTLEGTAVFIGCSNVDPHIPVDRVRESAITMKELGGTVLMKLYPMMGHAVNDDEIMLIKMFMGLGPPPGQENQETNNDATKPG
jgi:predicted esterase